MQGDGCRSHLQITISILHTYLNMQTSTVSILPCWVKNAVVCLYISIFGFLHASEYLNLKWSDITQTDKLTLTLHQSKTDPFQKGHQVLIFPTNTSTFPLWAFLLYAPSTNIVASDDLIFNASRFAPLTNTSLNRAICILLKNTGLDQSQCAYHSFWIGAPTTAAAARIPACTLTILYCNYCIVHMLLLSCII